MEKSLGSQREVHYDILRILAAFSVVMLHSAAQYWYALDIHSKDWIVANSYDAVFRFGVPIFVMISGALFLSPDYKMDIKRLYQRNILRMAILYILWSVLYGVYDVITNGYYNYGVKVILRELIYGRYHLWFLPMIIGVYMLLPMLKTWIEHTDKKQIEYILSLFLVFQIGVWTAKSLTVTDELHYILAKLDIELVSSYIGYFIWGYYLANIGLSDKLKKLFYILMIPSVILNVFLGTTMAWKYDRAIGEVYDSFGIFTFIIVTVLFVFAKDKWSKGTDYKGWNRLIKEMSANTLGVYLMHIMLLEFLERCGIHSMMINNVVGIPLLAVGCFIICMIVSALLRRVPFIGRYIC